MKLVSFVVIICVFVNAGLAQSKRANIWYFGRNAGLDFNSVEPVILDDGEINTNEGCSSIADEEGRLLFYTDGVTVWNRNHEIMENGTGLMGNTTSTQSALIVPQPGSDRFYYVFTVEPQGGVLSTSPEPEGFRYNVIDLAANNGMGAVTEKNVFLYAHTTEKLCATQHANGRDYWIATHEWDSDRFFIYKLTENGVDTNPVISEIGSIHQLDNSNSNATSQMKFSPNGRNLGLVIRELFLMELFDFNNASGVLSNVKMVELESKDAFHLYGFEFSSNSRLFYVSESASNGFPEQNVYQFQIFSDPVLISDSRTLITTGFINGSLQLAPNGNIYLTQASDLELVEIREPNRLFFEGQIGSLFIENNTEEGYFGLPNFVSSFLLPDDAEIEFPNVFTPNASDTINAVFEPRVFKRVEFFELKIFNRWGKEVYRTSDVKPAWWNGLGASAGVYYWHLEAEGTNGRPIEQRGVVHLIR